MPLEIIILAAGQGKRMKSRHPKVLHTIGGRPMLAHLLDTCSGLHPRAIHVIVGAGKEQVMAFVEQYRKHAGGGRKGAANKLPRISCVEQKKQLGTGHAVMQALPDVGKRSDVLVLNGDTPLVKRSTLKRVTSTRDNVNLLTVEPDDPRRMGRILRDESGQICGIVEYRDATAAQRQIREVNTNCLCTSARQLSAWLTRIRPKNAQGEYYLTDVISLAVGDGVSIRGISPTHTWETPDVNNRQDLAALERQYQKIQVAKLMDAGVTILDPARIDIRGQCRTGMDCTMDINVVLEGFVRMGHNVSVGPNCVIRDTVNGDGSVIEANSVIENARIGRNCTIGPFARVRPGTDLDDDVRIGNFVETKNSRIRKGSKANHLSYVGDSDVGTSVNIGAGVITCNYDGANKHRTRIGNNVFVGSDSQLVAPVEIADGATIGAGSTITDNVGSNALAVSRARQRSVSNWKRPQKNTTGKT